MTIVYSFQTKNGKKYETAYSPKEISKYQCFDAFRNGESKIILTKDVNFKSFSVEEK